MVAVQRVELPVRRVLARYVKASGRFVPCEWSDARGSLSMMVDQLGRQVVVVHGDQGEVGYSLTGHGDDDAGEFATWMKSHSRITREER